MAKKKERKKETRMRFFLSLVLFIYSEKIPLFANEKFLVLIELMDFTPVIAINFLEGCIVKNIFEIILNTEMHKTIKQNNIFF